jgi:hypothetical protein
MNNFVTFKPTHEENVARIRNFDTRVNKPMLRIKTPQRKRIRMHTRVRSLGNSTNRDIHQGENLKQLIKPIQGFDSLEGRKTIAIKPKLLRNLMLEAKTRTATSDRKFLTHRAKPDSKYRVKEARTRTREVKVQKPIFSGNRNTRLASSSSINFTLPTKTSDLFMSLKTGKLFCVNF